MPRGCLLGVSAQGVSAWGVYVGGGVVCPGGVCLVGVFQHENITFPQLLLRTVIKYFNLEILWFNMPTNVLN